MERAPDDEQTQLLQQKGFEHERFYLQYLRDSGKSVVDVDVVGNCLERRMEETRRAMCEGVDVVYQATLRDGSFAGHADFLVRVGIPSGLGPFGYEVYDTKLARTAQAKHVVQLGFYSALLEKVQGTSPVMMHVALGSGEQVSLRVADYAHYLAMARERFLDAVSGSLEKSTPEPCERCDFCPWRLRCEAYWLESDHLSQVAHITRLQIHRLEVAGVRTLRELAMLSEDAKLPKINAATLSKLRAQAALQLQARETGQRAFELLPLDPDGMRGFARLPRPDPGDLFFDMEGDPLEDGGLEYLFGVYWRDADTPRFETFWAHDRNQERVAFEAFMDFVTDHLDRNPNAHIYHYASYEATALKKLMSLHATCEAQVDNLLRGRKLVDLYKVVREGIRVSEPRYSIKNIEHFYLEARDAEVTNASASIVYYERWKTSRDPKLLREIENYNHDDVRSAYELRQWLLGIRPADVSWFSIAEEDASKAHVTVHDRNPEEIELEDYRRKLVDVLPADRTLWGKEEHLRELVWQLLGFHRRTAKPEWWAIFARLEMDDEELLEDSETLAGLNLDPVNLATLGGKMPRYNFYFPEQESKLKTGDGAMLIPGGIPVRDLVIDENSRRGSFSCKVNPDDLPSIVHLGPTGPISAQVLVRAIYRFATCVLADNGQYAALKALLRLDPPKLRNHEVGSPIVADGAEMSEIVDSVLRLENSYLYIQGPPGAGKTYTGSHVIVELLRQGFTVGVTSNSHKAINNLLAAIERVAIDRGVEFAGVKKCSAGKDEQLFDCRFVENVSRNEEVALVLGVIGVNLAAGTAWLFADSKLNQRVDYLFVDEAGQVALANLVAMGTSARNIVLLGDQMQLGQPIQGVHPGRSGESSLEYLLGGLATIPPDRGIFLARTWRMHPDVCRFISDAVYDGRLLPEANNASQTLLLRHDAHPVLMPTGIRFVSVEHDGCSQRCEVEAAEVAEIFDSLLQQRYRNKAGAEHCITLDNILVVAPYNMQVNLLKSVLPDGARVGTVDKFQGQEAEVVIISMATSSQEFLPRNMEFLYSKNRLNVAVSRARCLAVMVANPKLLKIDCSTPEQMELVNTLCWFAKVSGYCWLGIR